MALLSDIFYVAQFLIYDVMHQETILNGAKSPI